MLGDGKHFRYEWGFSDGLKGCTYGIAMRKEWAWTFSYLNGYAAGTRIRHLREAQNA